MATREEKAGDKTSATPAEKSQIAPPSISLPKGGGAIRGIGEKFAANPVTGTGSMTVPIFASPGRSGFGPQLSLSYDSGAGNGPFGLGWSLSIPSITRKTDKGLPRYQDADESDVFILSGAEDLVPTLVYDNGWAPEDPALRTVGGITYAIRRYRPRIEGLFARIERWTNQSDSSDSFWRSISKDNISTWYGKTRESRIFDPDDPTRIFSWLICESYDDKGNAILYEYAAEDSAGIDKSQVNEQNRQLTPSANRYIKRIKYGNRESRLQQPDLSSLTWLFELVFDYDEKYVALDTPDSSGRQFAKATSTVPGDSNGSPPPRPWQIRKDPFSSYRAGFEVRTYRLCQRVLMFHNFPDELGPDPCLVRSTDFTYSFGDDPQDAHKPIYSLLSSVTQTGYKQANGKYLLKSLPPVDFGYTEAAITQVIHKLRMAGRNRKRRLKRDPFQWGKAGCDELATRLVELGQGAEISLVCWRRWAWPRRR